MAPPTGRLPILCTPGTNVVMNGKLFTPHCINSKSKTYHGEQWVTCEIEVHGSGKIKHNHRRPDGDRVRTSRNSTDPRWPTPKR